MNPAPANLDPGSFSVNRRAAILAAASSAWACARKYFRLQPTFTFLRPARPRADLRRHVTLLAFTLIELLVVISIIGLLAGLTVGLSGVASRKSKESRIRGDLNRLVTLVENYKARMGSYPPSPETLIRNTSDIYDIPKLPPNNRVFISQLFYELSGTIFTNRPSPGFFVAGRQQTVGFMTVNQMTNVFQVDGFANSARDKRDVRYTSDFKQAEVKQITISGITAEFLAAPVAPPLSPIVASLSVTTPSGSKVYPWFYDASSANRINTDGFDLWTVVEIGKKVIRFSNWGGWAGGNRSVTYGKKKTTLRGSKTVEGQVVFVLLGPEDDPWLYRGPCPKWRLVPYSNCEILDPACPDASP